MARQIHTFDNGLRVYDDQLLEEQRARYRKRNVHEAEEEEIFLKLINRLPPNGCFVDVGAAIGYYLILAHKLAPGLAIHGLEPLERHRLFLAENLALNGIAPGEMTIHEEGLASSEGSSAFADRGYSSRLEADSFSNRRKHFLSKIGLRGKKDSLVSIPTITLDTFVRRIGRSVDLLQMDVQGLEVEVLKGGSESLKTGNVRTFLIGTHGRSHGLRLHEECCDLLRANGYTVEVDWPDPKEQPDGILVATKRSF